MAQNTPNRQLYDLLVSKNYDIQALDSRTGRGPVNDQGQPDINAADEFRFDFVSQSGRNYGSVVILFGDDNNLTMFFGDNVGRGMETEDKREWFDFLYQIKQFATKNFLDFQPENITKLKYTKQGQAAIKEGLFESWQGRGNMSWNGQPTEARLLIKHKKALGEGEARFRYIESIYIETADQERFKMKSRSLTAAKAMLEHVRQGGNPYDARAQHINEIVTELAVLSRFRRANAGRILEGDTKNLVEQTDAYYQNMHSVLKHLGTSRGYQGYFESWSPADVNEGNLVVEDLKSLFVEQTIDHRIEEALPILARITQEADSMKEAKIFESWINHLVEGTWALPETPEQKQTLIDLMSKDFPVGADATNATEQLYDVFGDDELFDRLQELADADANADARSVVMTRMQELKSASPDVEAVLGQLQTTNPAEPTVSEPDQQPVQGVAEGTDSKSAGQVIQKLQSFAKMNPDFTLSDLERLPSHGMSIKQVLTNAVQACDALKQQYLANKQAGNAQFIDNLKSEIKWFLTDRTQSQDPATLGELLQGTLGKVNFQQGVAEGLNEFAPPGSNDGGDDGFSEETLKRLASQWYNGDEDPRVERTLMAAGWEIGQDEGYDDEPGVFVVQAGDINGNSYISWPAHELKQGVAEGSDDIEDTRQFRNAIALAKSQKAIRQARYGKDQKFYADGTPVTPEEVARRAAERKAKKQGVAEYGDTAKGQKMLTKVQKRAVDRVVSKKADTDPAYAKKNQDTADRAWERMTDKDLAEGQCNMSEAGAYCPEHGLAECGMYEYTGNPTNFGLEEGDELARLKKLALNK